MFANYGSSDQSINLLNRLDPCLDNTHCPLHPTHGSWLNQAEIEIGIFSRQCLGSQANPPSEDIAPRGEGPGTGL
jgi:hypothetical protein